ncbi:hypothetical protein PRZ48_012543 [Zasmidium cellare]|uniref:Nudix hydrolase domain-containing protein n=1 Tax=Zasmidium cellare TaxID=395010 RepID=A0ABR0E553_ZASCE|nr:hypothetical protein PRZ48_012543 [Zasmidium cellare]
MAPKRKPVPSPTVEEGPAELFTATHAREFEEEHGLPPGSVAHAYRVQFGDLAPYVLLHLAERPPTVDRQGNIIWPQEPTLQRRNATAGFGKKTQQQDDDVEMTEDPEDPDETVTETPFLDTVTSLGLRRSNAVRGRGIRARTPSPELNPPSLQRRGAIRKPNKPVLPVAKWTGSKREAADILNALNDLPSGGNSPPRRSPHEEKPHEEEPHEEKSYEEESCEGFQLRL